MTLEDPCVRLYFLIFRVLEEQCLDISVVIPARDEQDNIGPLLTEVWNALDGICSFEIVVVDDGSSDETYHRAIATGELLGCQIQSVRHSCSNGQSAALMTGVRQAQGRWIITMDGDGQNDPADVPALIRRARAMENPVFCIAGFRKQRRDTAWKRFQSRLANRVRGALLADGVPDTGCGLKLIPRSTFLLLPCFDHMHRFLPALVRSQGGQVDVVVVNHRERQSGQSKYSAWNRLWVGLVDLVGVMWLQRRTKIPVIEKTGQSEPA